MPREQQSGEIITTILDSNMLGKLIERLSDDQEAQDAIMKGLRTLGGIIAAEFTDKMRAGSIDADELHTMTRLLIQESRDGFKDRYERHKKQFGQNQDDREYHQ